MTNKQSKPDQASTIPARPVVEAIEAAIEAVRELAAQRCEQKLSVSRLMGVSRELRELLKVMSIYGA